MAGIIRGCQNLFSQSKGFCQSVVRVGQGVAQSGWNRLPSFSQVSTFVKCALSHSVGRVTGLTTAAFSLVPSAVVGFFVGFKERYNGISQLEGQQYGQLIAYGTIASLGGATAYTLQSVINPHQDLGTNLMSAAFFTAVFQVLFGSRYAVPLFSKLGGMLNTVGNLANSALYGISKGMLYGSAGSYKFGSQSGEWVTEKASNLGVRCLTIAPPCIRTNPIGNQFANLLQLIGEIAPPILMVLAIDQKGVQIAEFLAKAVPYGLLKVGQKLGYESFGQLVNQLDFTKGIENNIPLGLKPLFATLLFLEVTERVMKSVFSYLHPKAGPIGEKLTTVAGAIYIASEYYSGNFEESRISAIAGYTVTGLVSAAEYLYHSEAVHTVLDSSPQVLNYLVTLCGSFLSYAVQKAPSYTAVLGLAFFGWLASHCFVNKKQSLNASAPVQQAGAPPAQAQP
jgi:hypothetical protein